MSGHFHLLLSVSDCVDALDRAEGRGVFGRHPGGNVGVIITPFDDLAPALYTQRSWGQKTNERRSSGMANARTTGSWSLLLLSFSGRGWYILLLLRTRVTRSVTNESCDSSELCPKSTASTLPISLPTCSWVPGTGSLASTRFAVVALRCAHRFHQQVVGVDLVLVSYRLTVLRMNTGLLYQKSLSPWIGLSRL
jgi:hypothetical protein